MPTNRRTNGLGVLGVTGDLPRGDFTSFCGYLILICTQQTHMAHMIQLQLHCTIDLRLFCRCGWMVLSLIYYLLSIIIY